MGLMGPPGPPPGIPGPPVVFYRKKTHNIPKLEINVRKEFPETWICDNIIDNGCVFI